MSRSKKDKRFYKRLGMTILGVLFLFAIWQSCLKQMCPLCLRKLLTDADMSSIHILENKLPVNTAVHSLLR